MRQEEEERHTWPSTRGSDVNHVHVMTIMIIMLRAFSFQPLTRATSDGRFLPFPVMHELSLFEVVEGK